MRLLVERLFAQSLLARCYRFLQHLDWTCGEGRLFQYKQLEVPSENRCRRSHYVDPLADPMGRILADISASFLIPEANPGRLVNVHEKVLGVLVKQFSDNRILDRMKVRTLYLI